VQYLEINVFRFHAVLFKICSYYTWEKFTLQLTHYIQCFHKWIASDTIAKETHMYMPRGTVTIMLYAYLIKVKLSLYITVSLGTMPWKYMKWRYSAKILNLGIRWSWVFSFTLLPLYLHGVPPAEHWIGGWVGRRAGLDCMEKRKSLALCRLSNLGHPSHILFNTPSSPRSRGTFDMQKINK
jgi:hypothetical protein